MYQWSSNTQEVRLTDASFLSSIHNGENWIVKFYVSQYVWRMKRGDD